VQNTVDLDDCHLVTLDSESELGEGRLVDDAEAVALSLDHVEHRPGCAWSTIVTTLAVDETRVRNWLFATAIVVVKVFLGEGLCEVMIPEEGRLVGFNIDELAESPIIELNDGCSIVDVCDKVSTLIKVIRLHRTIIVDVRVLGIVDDESSSLSVNVLS
jgi:hypothetical protein